MNQQITLKNLDKPKEKDIKEDLYWFCDSLGFSSGRDIEHMSQRIVYDLLERVKEYDRIPSDIIARDLFISSARVNHHIRNLIDSGFLYRENKMIVLRGGSLKSAVREMRRDAERIFDDLENIADDIDKAFGIKNR